MDISHVAIAKIVYETCKDDLLYTDSFYAWDNETTLWRRCNKLAVKSYIDRAANREDTPVNVREELKKCSVKSAVLCELEEFLHSNVIFNNNIYEFPVADGQIINFKYKMIRQRTKTDKFTVASPVKYDPNANCAVFRKYIDDITLNDKEVEKMLQKALGSCLTGVLTKELYNLHGTGSNSKTMLMKFMQVLLGDFCKLKPSDYLCNRIDYYQEHDDYLEDVEDMKDKRVFIIQEGDLKYKSGRVKELTGGDTFWTGTGRAFIPSMKIVIVTNEPLVGTDESLRRRIVNIPFKARFTKEPKLPHERLQDVTFERMSNDQQFMSSMLNWLMQGAQEVIESL